MAQVPTQADDPADYGTGEEGAAARWHDEIQHAREDAKVWLKQCDEIERRYRSKKRTDTDESVYFNVLWSNVETLKPAVYARPPVPVVSRRYHDQDPVGRAAALILRRNIQHALDVGEVHSLVKMIVQDYLLYARGVLWARYEPHFDTPARPAGTPAVTDVADDEGVQITNDAENEQEVVTWEEVEWDFVHRRDFLCGPARTWAEVPWVARRVWMTRRAGMDRFGKKFRDVPLRSSREQRENQRNDDQQESFFARASVWEIWSMDDRCVYWIADGYDGILDEVDDPLGLDGFFPCAKPLFGTLTSDSLTPVPDYVEYQDQANELDDLTARIAAVTESIMVRGLYDARHTQLSRLFEEGTENQLIPVEQYAEFSAKGGFEGALQFLPIERFVEVLNALIMARTAVKADLYEITGIADILRGSTQPQETATAQQIKGRYATLRLSDRQLEVARFVRDVLRITGEIIAKHFSPQTMALASNFQMSDIAQDSVGQEMPPGVDPAVASQMLLMQAVDLLKNDQLRSFRIDIEDQSTIALDDQAEKEARTEFLLAFGSFLEKAMAVPAALAPTVVPLLGKLLMFGVRGFRVGADMEAAIEDALAKISAQVQQQAQNPQPDPEAIKAQAEAQVAQMEIQARQAQLRHEAQQAEAERQLKLMDMRAKISQQEAQNAQDLTQHHIAIARQQLEADRFELERLQADRDHEVKLAELRLRELEIGIKARQADDGMELKREAMERVE